MYDLGVFAFAALLPSRLRATNQIIRILRSKGTSLQEQEYRKSRKNLLVTRYLLFLLYLLSLLVLICTEDGGPLF